MSATNPPVRLYMRKPRRVSVTVSQGVMERLQRHSDEQGRSTSNLAAHLLEVALDGLDAKAPTPKSWPSQVA